MIFETLRDYASHEPDRLCLRDASEALTAREVFDKAREIAPALAALPSDRIGFYAADSVRLILCLLASQSVGKNVCVLNRSFKPEEVAAILQRLGTGAVVADMPLTIPNVDVYDLGEISRLRPNHPSVESSGRAREGAITILTTGTTGLPKAALHNWDRLMMGRHKGSGDPHTWLLAYPLNHFAGIQVLLHVLHTRGTLVVAPSRDYGAIISAMCEHNVDSLSATPTFWRMIIGRMSAEQRRTLHLTQITIGGEASTAELLERLQSHFPHASVTQVYATTELGTCFSVKDGLPGFPAAYLERQVGNVQLTIADGELYARSPARMVTYVDGSPLPEEKDDWIATGDMVEKIGDRVLFRGRKTEIINVGGVKVHPLKVEETVLRVPGISAARVYGRPNPVTGQIVACDIELAADAAETVVRDAVQRACLRELNRYEQPRHLSFVPRLDRRNEKLVRA
ncbi:MAG TPA: class I adenylate-forming enzyme family protein [Vicinamibacterales bacterium]|jgi:acyl-CoA synthetase (AMP-forming)/AMP-acid ligase II